MFPSRKFLQIEILNYLKGGRDKDSHKRINRFSLEKEKYSLNWNFSNLVFSKEPNADLNVRVPFTSTKSLLEALEAWRWRT